MKKFPVNPAPPPHWFHSLHVMIDLLKIGEVMFHFTGESSLEFYPIRDKVVSALKEWAEILINTCGGS